VRLWVDGALVIDNWTDHAAREDGCGLAMEAGRRYDVRMEFYENAGQAVAKLFWASARQAKEVVPAECVEAPANVALPSVPEDLHVAHLADRVAVLAWAPPAEGTLVGGYEVFRDGKYLASVSTPEFRDASLLAGTAYRYAVRSVGVVGGVSVLTPELTVTTLPAPADGTGTGLLARIYDNQDFTARTVVRVDPRLDFNWGTGVPATGVGADAFSIRWQGQLQPRYSEQYTIYTLSDDGIRVWVDGQPVIDNWTDHSAKEDKGTLSLQAGRKYDLRVDFYEKGGNARAALLWESLSQPKEVVPTTRLYPAEFLGGTDVRLVSSVASPVSPAWVEGKCSEDTVSIRFRADGGEEKDAILLDSESWYADTASAPLGIPLNMENPTSLSVVASDGMNSQTHAYSLVWSPTSLTGKSWSEDEMLVRKGDRLLLTATGTGAVLTIDANGDGQIDFTGAPGDKVPFEYGVAGTFTAEAWIDGDSVGSLAVTVVHVDLCKPIACQVGYQREKDVWVAPAPAAGKVVFSSADMTSLAVSVKGLVAAQDGQTATLYLKPLKRGTPVLVARLPGEAGPVVTTAEVDEFQLEFSNVTLLIPDQATGCADADMYMAPLIRDLEVRFNMFASTCTFPGGIKSFSASTNDFALEAGPEEATGIYPYVIEIPDDEDRACYNVTVYQDGKQVSFKE